MAADQQDRAAGNTWITAGLHAAAAVASVFSPVATLVEVPAPTTPA